MSSKKCPAADCGKLEEYFQAAFEEKLTVKMPERETDHLTSATKLLEKRREMAEVENALIVEKEEFQMKMESLQQRREELERKELLLKESLQKFDKFLTENDLKRTRAVLKANVEREAIKQKTNEIKTLEDEQVDISDNKEKIQRRLDKHKKYQKFLDKICEKSDDFNEVWDIIHRYDTLTLANKELLDISKEHQTEMENRRRNLAEYSHQMHNEILSCNNELAGLQSKLDAANSDAMKWENNWTHIKNTAAKKTLTLGKIRVAIYNLYQLVQRYNKHHKSDDKEVMTNLADTDDQLARINQYFQNMASVINDVKKQGTSGSNNSLFIPSSTNM